MVIVQATVGWRQSLARPLWGAHRQFVVDGCILIQLPRRGHFFGLSPEKA